MPNRGAEQLGGALLNLIFPPGCASCSKACPADQAFCSQCLDDMVLIDPPYCQRCGKPQLATESQNLCPECRQSSPAFDRARALGLHQGALARAVRALKYHGRLSAGEALARFWAEAIPPRWLRGADICAPVPLHPLRLIKRGFNQSLSLSARLALPGLIPDLLIRRRHTKPQVGLGPEQRRQNVAQAFSLRPKYASQVEGARIMLVDDVFTTGATVTECARELKFAGAAWVGVLTLVRAGREPEPQDLDHETEEGHDGL